MKTSELASVCQRTVPHKGYAVKEWTEKYVFCHKCEWWCRVYELLTREECTKSEVAEDREDSREHKVKHPNGKVYGE